MHLDLVYILGIIISFVIGLLLPFNFDEDQKIKIASFIGRQGEKLFFIIIAAWITYKFGIKKYLSQREHEQIKKRYIDNGIDLAIEGIEHVFAIYRRNFTNALKILKNFRQKQNNSIIIEPSEYDEKSFSRYNQEAFIISPFQKIVSLLGPEGKVYHHAVQNLFAKIDISSNFFELDLCVGIKAFLDGKLRVNAEEFFQDYIGEIEKRHKEIDKYYVLIAELQLISRLVETNVTTTKSIDEFEKLPEIRASLTRMNKVIEEIKE